MISDADLTLVGKLNVLDTLKKMKEYGGDLNNIQFNYAIKKDVEKLSSGFNFQFWLGRISAFHTFKEMVRIGDNLNLVNFEKLIEQNLREINDKDLAKEASSLTDFTLLFDRTSPESPHVDYSASNLILDLKKCEKLLDSLLREKYSNQTMLPDEFPKEFHDADQTRINENPRFAKREFNDAIEYMPLNTKLYILNRKKKEWGDIPKFVVDAFVQIRDVLISSSNPNEDSLEREISFETKLLGKVFCKKIIDFFEKSNFSERSLKI